MQATLLYIPFHNGQIAHTSVMLSAKGKIGLWLTTWQHKDLWIA